tara:strand:+ start:169011 stop:169787 length:777 start_codon:yes stop_codon:yes gene_type:complete
MLAIVSPAKKLNFTDDFQSTPVSQPIFMDEIQSLIAIMKTKSQADLMQLMHISENLATLNHSRFQNFADQFDVETARQAVYLFQGDTYVGLQAENFSAEELDYAQQHFAILSGLYGLLRPLDMMQPYRLEMGTKLANGHGEDLYSFWRGKLTSYIETALKTHKNPYIINLASAEYIKAINAKSFGDKFITCHFKEDRGGQLKTIGLMAKRARGAMARYIVQNKIDTPEGLKSFTTDGYAYTPELSDPTNLHFVRVQLK